MSSPAGIDTVSVQAVSPGSRIIPLPRSKLPVLQRSFIPTARGDPLRAPQARMAFPTFSLSLPFTESDGRCLAKQSSKSYISHTESGRRPLARRHRKGLTASGIHKRGNVTPTTRKSEKGKKQKRLSSRSGRIHQASKAKHLTAPDAREQLSESSCGVDRRSRRCGMRTLFWTVLDSKIASGPRTSPCGRRKSTRRRKIPDWVPDCLDENTGTAKLSGEHEATRHAVCHH